MAFTATRKLARNRQLRRLLTAWTAFYTGTSAHSVLVIVYLFAVAGPSGVAAATLARMLPGGLLAPLTTGLATSTRPQLHLALGIGARVAVMVATLAAVLDGSSLGLMLVLLTVDSIVSTAVRPLHGGLVVRLADTAAEAAAANAVTGSLVNATTLAGPALAGLALGLVGVGWAFVLPAASFAIGTAAALMITAPRAEEETRTAGPGRSRAVVRAHLLAVRTGFRAIVTSGPAAAATTLFVLNVILMGIWFVVGASVAVDQLALGEGGITTISTVGGAGGVLASLATLSIVGRRGLAVMLAGGMLGWAVALAAIAAIVAPLPAMALAGAVGAAGAVGWAVAPTLVQRSVTRDAMVPASASLQSLSQIGTAAGSAIAAVLIGTFGVTATLVLAGGAVAVVTAMMWPLLRRADVLSTDDAAKLAVITATPSLALLPALALEQLARAATRLTTPAGAEVVREGDPGDRFYMIASGLADVTVDGRLVATLGPGGSFGEIALLHDVPRSATVTARADLDLVVVDRAEFLGALSAEADAVGRMGGIARVRLATPPVEERLVGLERDAALSGRSAVEVLAGQPPLAGLDTDALRELAEAAHVVAARDGAFITREGDYADTYYVIIDGAAEVLEGAMCVRRLAAGDGFGEQAILRDVPRTATVRAAGYTTLLAVDRESFQRARRVA